MDLDSNSGDIALNDNVIFSNGAATSDPGGADITTGSFGAVSLSRNSFLGNVCK